MISKRFSGLFALLPVIKYTRHVRYAWCEIFLCGIKEKINEQIKLHMRHPHLSPCACRLIMKNYDFVRGSCLQTGLTHFVLRGCRHWNEKPIVVSRTTTPSKRRGHWLFLFVVNLTELSQIVIVTFSTT